YPRVSALLLPPSHALSMSLDPWRVTSESWFHRGRELPWAVRRLPGLSMRRVECDAVLLSCCEVTRNPTMWRLPPPKAHGCQSQRLPSSLFSSNHRAAVWLRDVAASVSARLFRSCWGVPKGGQAWSPRAMNRLLFRKDHPRVEQVAVGHVMVGKARLDKCHN
ncbi:unnamed protein product, partial [Cyprideis torosa]